MKKIVFALSAAVACVAFADLKIAVVNMPDLVKFHPQHESNKTLVKSTSKDNRAKLDRQQEALKAIMDDVKKAQEEYRNPMLSAQRKLEIQKNLESLEQKFMAGRQEMEAAVRHYQEELSDLESRLLRMETDDLRVKIADYAKKNGYDLILEKPLVGFAKDSLDVTDDILKVLGVDPAKRKEQADEGK